MIDAIISIKPRHVENILSGKKTVELRTRGLNLPEGSRLWIYTTLPVGKVMLFAEIDFIDRRLPTEIWKNMERISVSPRKSLTNIQKIAIKWPL